MPGRRFILRMLIVPLSEGCSPALVFEVKKAGSKFFGSHSPSRRIPMFGVLMIFMISRYPQTPPQSSGGQAPCPSGISGVSLLPSVTALPQPVLPAVSKIVEVAQLVSLSQIEIFRKNLVSSSYHQNHPSSHFPACQKKPLTSLTSNSCNENCATPSRSE